MNTKTTVVGIDIAGYNLRAVGRRITEPIRRTSSGSKLPTRSRVTVRDNSTGDIVQIVTNAPVASNANKKRKLVANKNITITEDVKSETPRAILVLKKTVRGKKVVLSNKNKTDHSTVLIKRAELLVNQLKNKLHR